MKKINILPRPGFIAGSALMLMMVACQGRTAADVTPSGETIEVVAAPGQTDSSTYYTGGMTEKDIPTQQDTLQNEN